MYKITDRDIIKACLLYYEENKTQEEISGLLGVSRYKISRILRDAKRKGIVTIHVNDPMGSIG